MVKVKQYILTIFSLLAYLKTINMFCKHSYLIVLFYNINLGNAHIIRSWYLKQLIWTIVTLLFVCCIRTVINFFFKFLLLCYIFFYSCFIHFFIRICSVAVRENRTVLKLLKLANSRTTYIQEIPSPLSFFSLHRPYFLFQWNHWQCLTNLSNGLPTGRAQDRVRQKNHISFTAEFMVITITSAHSFFNRSAYHWRIDSVGQRRDMSWLIINAWCAVSRCRRLNC